MEGGLWSGIFFICLSGYFLYLIRSKKHKGKNAALNGGGVVFGLVGAIKSFTPFVSKLVARWFFDA